MDRSPRIVVFAIAVAFASWLAGRAVRTSSSLSVEDRALRATSVTVEEKALSPGVASHGASPLSDEQLATLVEASLREEGRANQMHALYAVASDFQPADFPRALAVLASVETEEARGLRSALAAFWLESDRPSARAWLSALPAAERAGIFPDVVRTWARLDPVDLRAWLASFPSGESAGLATEAQSEVATALMRVDPEMALEFLAGLPRSDGGWNPEAPPPYIAAFIEWGKRDPEAAGARLLELPTDVRGSCMHGLIESWVVHDPAAAEAWIDGLTDAPLVAGAVQAFVYNRTDLSPRGAAEFILRHWQWLPQMSENGIYEIDHIAGSWAEEDEDAALAWVKSLPDEKTRWQGLHALISGVSDRDPSHAADLWMTEYGSRKDFSGWSSAIEVARDLAMENGFSAGADFIARLHDKLRSDTAGRFIQALTSGGRSIGPVETARLVLQQQADEFRTELLRPAFEKLASAGEIGEARQLAATLPAGPQRDAAVSGFLAGQLRRDPDAALRFLAAVDPSQGGRELLLTSIANLSQNRNPPLASWLQSTPLLSAAEKQRVQAMQKETK